MYIYIYICICIYILCVYQVKDELQMRLQVMRLQMGALGSNLHCLDVKDFCLK